MVRRGALLFAAALVLGGCTSVPADSVHFMERHSLAAPSPEAFTVCYAYGCRRRAKVSLAPKEWAEVRAVFDPPPVTAVQERARIAKAVGLLEVLAGRQAGTLGDVGGTLTGLGDIYQFDCVDEALNTTSYLIMMAADGLLRFNRLRGPATRGFFIMGWPHTTAAVVDTKTDEAFVIDSWFFDNGRPATVAPLNKWMGGWSPPGAARI